MTNVSRLLNYIEKKQNLKNTTSGDVMRLRNISWADWIFAIVGTALAPLGVFMILAEAWLPFAALVVGFFGVRAGVLYWIKVQKSRQQPEKV